jgi:hypothetical protein
VTLSLVDLAVPQLSLVDLAVRQPQKFQVKLKSEIAVASPKVREEGHSPSSRLSRRLRKELDSSSFLIQVLDHVGLKLTPHLCYVNKPSPCRLANRTRQPSHCQEVVPVVSQTFQTRDDGHLEDRIQMCCGITDDVIEDSLI